MNAYAQKEKAPSEKDKTGIPAQMKTKFERSSGFSFDDVRVHYNSEKPAQLHAHAYTQGNEVYVAPGQEKHLPHELGHVVQQKSNAVQPTGEIGGMPLNNDEAMESGADKLAELAENSEESGEVPLQAKAKDGGVVQRSTQDAYNVSAGPLAFIAAIGSIGYAMYNYHKANKHERKHRYIEEIEKYSEAACDASEEYTAAKSLANAPNIDATEKAKAEAEKLKQKEKAERNYTSAKNKVIAMEKLTSDMVNPGQKGNNERDPAEKTGFFANYKQEKYGEKVVEDRNKVFEIKNDHFNKIENDNVKNALVRAREAVKKCRDDEHVDHNADNADEDTDHAGAVGGDG